MKVGDVEVLAVADGVGVEVAAEILSRPGVEDAWACHGHHLEADGTLQLPLGGFLVRTAGRTVLVDAGVGPVDDGRYRGGGLLDSLAALGTAPEDVTDVVFTHLHFDHIGWASLDGAPVFERAVHRVHRADWEHFVTGPQRVQAAADTLAPIVGQIELFDGDFTVAPGLDAVHTPGHTPGTTVFVASGQGRRALLLGDVFHSVVQFEEPDWQVIWDVDPAAARAARNRIADQAGATGDLVVAAHLPGMRFGRVITGDGPRRFTAV
ncbi:MBL fold metallo-hydrolase [Streptomyces sp. FH025]|uniref:MBL fold metallo-hydrolase n=1 Tax=Streptomyces sp. FH025 TaxID=2815937 RepID=UPI001A9CC653|nr:MBL fold metallo-hydrolase [Streptomyces sp. FH025]MBO1420452.1 MBL fold metallo-hydrolase [Streptomyces sp. FH025]